MPSILEYVKRKNELPKGLLFSLASLIAFYKGEREGVQIPLKDNPSAIDFFTEQWKSEDIPSIVKATLENEDFWGMDLTRIEGILEAVIENLKAIASHGMKKALKVFKDKSAVY